MINPISGPRPLSSTAPVRKKQKASRTSSSSFSSHLDETEGTSGTSGTGSLGAISGVFNLQEVEDALSGEAKGKLRAEDMLAKLDDLRLDLLSGTISTAKLQRLSQIVSEKKAEINDPKLNGILDEIDLRAQVELAKFMRN